MRQDPTITEVLLKMLKDFTIGFGWAVLLIISIPLWPLLYAIKVFGDWYEATEQKIRINRRTAQTDEPQ